MNSDVAEFVFRYVPDRDIISCAQTCKKLNAAAVDFIWQRHRDEIIENTLKILNHVINCPNARSTFITELNELRGSLAGIRRIRSGNLECLTTLSLYMIKYLFNRSLRLEIGYGVKDCRLILTKCFKELDSEKEEKKQERLLWILRELMRHGHLDLAVEFSMQRIDLVVGTLEFDALRYKLIENGRWQMVDKINDHIKSGSRERQ